MTLLRPISLAAFVVLAAALAMAVDASPQSAPNSVQQAGAGQSHAAVPRCSPPPCGEGRGVGVVPVGTSAANTADPPPRPSPTRGEGEEGREWGAALPSPLAAQPLDRLPATRERPLFSPTRRPSPPPPPVVAAPEPPPPPPPPPDVALFGIVMDGDEAHAVVRAGPTDKIMRVGVGDDIGGWKVAQIEERRLVLSLDGRIATFMMFAGNSAKGAARSDQETQSADRQSQGQAQPQNQMRQNPPPPYEPGARRPHRPR
jgi:hypothetical protein